MSNPPYSAIIKAKPIGHRLDAFRDSISKEPGGLSFSNEGLQDHAPNLVLALQALPVSRQLPSHSGETNLFGDLSKLNLSISNKLFNLERMASLLKAVLRKETDNTIWDEVYKVVADVPFVANVLPVAAAKPSTPPPSAPPPTTSVQQTPWSFNTGSLVGTSDYRKDIDRILRNEMEDKFTVDHPNIFNTFFGGVPRLLEMSTAVLQSCKDATPPLFQEAVGWVGWPDSCEEIAVLAFLRLHINQFLSLADKHDFRPSKRRHYITTPNKPIPGSVSKRKLDVGLTRSLEIEDSSQEGYDWSHILVPGELKSNPREDNHSSTWLDLVRYAREIFSAQDTRRFVLGFTLCGSIMRLWEFDRLGAIGSTAFDINNDGETFVSVLLGYLWMSEEELGFDPTIVDDNGRYTTIQRNGQAERVYLQELMMRQRSIAGRATTCWRALLADEPDKQVVIKDSWEYEERPEEGLLLKEATESGVENVARYYHHETIYIGGKKDEVLYNVRKGLGKTNRRNAFQRSSLSKTTSLAMSNSSSSRRGGSTSRSKIVAQKRPSSRLQLSIPPSKRSCLDFAVNQDSVPRNRVHRRLIMRDFGKSIYEGSSPRAILTGLLGGIKGHESLLKANILHRDISIGNVMLNIAEDDGFLIDLDLAIKIDRPKASGAPSKTGTKVFMAIGALYGADHTFMHDLESFFWVLLWSCYYCTGLGGQHHVSPIETWNFLDTKTLGRLKSGLVLEEDGFNMEVNENVTAFCTPLLPCLKELRKVVFPEGKRWLRSDPQLYARMKAVLQQARKDLQE